MKTVKHSIALVIGAGGGRVLMVLRPADDESLPGVWGLPAISVAPGEDEEQAVRRAGREKLGVELLPGSLQGEAETDRPAYALRMRNREAAISQWRSQRAAAPRGHAICRLALGRPDRAQTRRPSGFALLPAAAASPGNSAGRPKNACLEPKRGHFWGESRRMGEDAVRRG